MFSGVVVLIAVSLLNLRLKMPVWYHHISAHTQPLSARTEILHLKNLLMKASIMSKYRLHTLAFTNDEVEARC